MTFNNRFVITLNEKDAKIDFIKGTEIHSSIIGNLDNKEEVDNFFSQSKNSRIIIILDNVKTDKIEKDFPNFSKDEAHTKAKEFLTTQYDDNKFSALLNDNSHYIYYNIEITAFIRSWLDYIIELNNRIHSIYMVIDKSKTIDIVNISSKNKELLKLYNPSLSPIIFTELVNFYIRSILIGEATFMTLFFLILWKYI